VSPANFVVQPAAHVAAEGIADARGKAANLPRYGADAVDNERFVGPHVRDERAPFAGTPHILARRLPVCPRQPLCCCGRVRSQLERENEATTKTLQLNVELLKQASR